MRSHTQLYRTSPALTPTAIGCCASNALLEEVAVFPKPGLVTPYDTGAHTDMDIALFSNSAVVLQPYFIRCAELGRCWAKQGLACLDAGLLNALRPLGQSAEKTMFAATGGVNTHKGMIFSLGLLCAAAAYVVEGNRQALLPAVFEHVQTLTQGLVGRELDRKYTFSSKLTAGERLYLRYGVTGIRGEAEKGFPLVRTKALPALRGALEQGLAPNTAAVQVLLLLMQHTEDTNVLHRAGRDGLEFVRSSAAHTLEAGGMLTPMGVNMLNSLCDSFRKKNISPGGSADLLAISIFLYDLYVLSTGQHQRTFSQLKTRRDYGGDTVPFTTVCTG